MDPPLAFDPVGVVREVMIEEPLASLERAMAAEALMSAFTISPSRILAELTESLARSARAIVPSRILAVVTDHVPRVRTPALVVVASPEIIE